MERRERSVPTNGKIAFNRYDVAADAGSVFTINPDATIEHQVGTTGNTNCAGWSPDGSKILVCEFISGGARPVTANPDGSGATVFGQYPQMSLACSFWSPNGARFLCSGSDANAADNGLYTLRSSDGGDLSRVTVTPDTYSDYAIGYSRDGSRILFNRVTDADQNALYTVNPNGTGLLRITPPRLSVVDLGFFDAVSADWSPDGSHVTFAASWKAPPGRQTALFVVNAHGTGLRQITPSGLGALSAQWSPNGELIAFTSKRLDGMPLPQVWVVHPDGTSRTELTFPTNGDSSLAPVWSPDGTTAPLPATAARWARFVDGECKRPHQLEAHEHTSGLAKLLHVGDGTHLLTVDRAPAGRCLGVPPGAQSLRPVERVEAAMPTFFVECYRPGITKEQADEALATIARQQALTPPTAYVHSLASWCRQTEWPSS